MSFTDAPLPIPARLLRVIGSAISEILRLRPRQYSGIENHRSMEGESKCVKHFPWVQSVAYFWHLP